MAKLLEGKLIAQKIAVEIKQQVEVLNSRPVLASIMVGEDAGAAAYVKSQIKLAESLGIKYQFNNLAQNTREDSLVDLIKKLNSDKSVQGIIIQKPLPEQVSYEKISRFILPEKDVEGLNSPTAAAAMELIKASGVDLYGKEVVVVGASEIVGKPLVSLLLDKFATVTVCHIGTSKAGKLVEHVRAAEVLIVAVGKAGLIKGDWIKEGAVVIDVGINRVNDKIVGDVEFDSAEKRAAYITPVPGGVGPLTVTMLMRNLVEAAKLQQ